MPDTIYFEHKISTAEDEPNVYRVYQSNGNLLTIAPSAALAKRAAIRNRVAQLTAELHNITTHPEFKEYFT